ncbi:hypothetical protein [Halopiger aswanensis]|nr:hypothetical protein [Halopiger aswanensis]
MYDDETLESRVASQEGETTSGTNRQSAGLVGAGGRARAVRHIS